MLSLTQFLFLLMIGLILSQWKVHFSSLAITKVYEPNSGFDSPLMTTTKKIEEGESNRIVGENYQNESKVIRPTQSQLQRPPLQHQASSPFCRSLAYSIGSNRNRTMVHAFVTNSGHLQLLENALLSMQRSGSNWTPVVFSLSNQTELCEKLTFFQKYYKFKNHVVCVPYLERLFQQLQRDEPDSVKQIQPQLPPTNINLTHRNDSFRLVDTGFHVWGSIEHKFMINAKLYALRDILDCHADAFITDVDIAFAQDPRPYFDVKTVDVIAQNDTTIAYELSINSGFMYWKHTDANRKLIQDVITIPPFWWIDQSRVNTVLHNQSTPHVLLDANLFPNGYMIRKFIENNQTSNQNNVIVAHANWNVGSAEKRSMLESLGLWLVGK